MQKLTTPPVDWSGAAIEASEACTAAAKSGTAEACAEAARLSWAVVGMIPDDGFIHEDGQKESWAKGARYWERLAKNGGHEPA